MYGQNQPGFVYDPEVEGMPRTRLLRLQGEKLAKTVERAFACLPAFRAKCETAGLAPADLRHREDLHRFPFMTKDDLREGYPFGSFAVPRNRVARIHASSGTTGQPTVAGYTLADLDVWAELMARSLVAGGVRPGDMVHNAHGYGLFTGGLGVHYGAERLGCTVVPASGGGTQRQVMLLRDFRANVLVATPSYALHIAEVASEMGVDLESGPLTIGICGAEPWSDALRGQIQSRLGIKASDLYGLSEVLGPGVAVECMEGRNGLHGWEDHFLFEVVDPETGEPLAEGREGELVITTLSKEAQPFIRYRTGDLTRLDTGLCSCGRTHVRLARIAGRCDSMLIIRGMNVFPSQIEAILLEHCPRIAPHYRLVVEHEGALDTLTVEVETMKGIPASDHRAISALVECTVKDFVGVTCRCTVLVPGELPRSEGKAVRVCDRRGKADRSGG